MDFSKPITELFVYAIPLLKSIIRHLLQSIIQPRVYLLQVGADSWADGTACLGSNKDGGSHQGQSQPPACQARRHWQVCSSINWMISLSVPLQKHFNFLFWCPSRHSFCLFFFIFCLQYWYNFEYLLIISVADPGCLSQIQQQDRNRRGEKLFCLTLFCPQMS